MTKEEILARLKNWIEVHKQVAEQNYKMDPAARYERDLVRDLERLFQDFERPENDNPDWMIL